MICPNCQTSNPDHHHFCLHCGMLLGSRCPRCGTEAMPQANFCGSCGLALTPQAQFLWQAGTRPFAGRPVSAADSSEPSRAAAAHEPVPELPASQPHLDQYIPRELRAKLESARAGGGMEGERRVVTMLFCDVKGSTAAAEQLDPEDWTEIINGAFEFMIRPVYKYEGTVARLMGDGILAFFGAPIAHEDDPRRAILTGLEILSGLAPYREKIQQRWQIDLNVRVGINTGLVVVGAVGSDLRMEYTAMGDAINLAARMEQTAAPGTVQVAHDTHRLVAPLFDFEELGGVQVKGKADPVPAYRVLGVKASAGQMRGIEGLEAGLVGRAQEMEQLKAVLADLDRGIGGIVCLLGGAGLGKSRLIREVRQSLNGDSKVQWVETASLSYESGFPYALFQRLLRRLSGIAAGDDTESFWDKVQALTGDLEDDQAARTQRVFASLFDLPDPSGQPPLEGELFKRELYAAMGEIWQSRFSTRPAVLVFDDLHWADPASIDLLLHLLPTVENSPLVLLCAFRPEREGPAYQIKQRADAEFHHRYTEISLSPLSPEESDELVDRLLAIADLPDDLRQRIRERAAGNPFFVEEVVRSLIEKGAVVAEDRSENGSLKRYWQATSSGTSIDIPDNLQGLLASRIDRLEEGTRRVVQMASVIGRSFYQRVLAEIGRPDELAVSWIDDHVRSLVRLEMVQEAARVPEVEYRFRNPLTQEIAYQSILLKRRREFHRRVGEALEALFPEQLSELAPRLAFHFSEAQQAEKALAYFTLAGDTAYRLFALEGALANYRQAMDWAEKGGASSQELIRLYRRRGRTLELLLRHAEAMELYHSLEELGKARGDDALRLAGLAAQGISYTVSQFDFENSDRYSQEALALARQLGDRRTETRSLWGLLLSYTWFDSRQALAYGESGLAIARQLADDPDATNEDLELLALILVDLTIPLAGDGRTDAARQYAAEARELFERIGNLPMASTAAQRLGVAYRAEANYVKAVAAYEQSMAIDQSIGNEGGLVGNTMGLMDVYRGMGDFGQFLAMVDLGIPILAREGRIPVQVYEIYRILAYFHLGALDQVLQMENAIKQLKENGTLAWPEFFMCYVVRSHLRSGDVKAAKEALAKIENGSDMENFLLPIVAAYPQARAETALAEGALEAALAIVDVFLERVKGKNVQAYIPEKLLLKGIILNRMERPDQAYAVFKEAHAVAKEQPAHTMIWQICFHLAELELMRGNEAKARSFKEEARRSIDFIVEHAGRDELRRSFLGIPQVQSILSDTGEKHVDPITNANQ